MASSLKAENRLNGLARPFRFKLFYLLIFFFYHKIKILIWICFFFHFQKILLNNEIPFVFVTNGTYCSQALVDILTNALQLPITADHCVVAPSPCIALTDYHDKHVLVCCQEESNSLVKELGFSSYMTIDELCELFPELDYVDHRKRKELLVNQLSTLYNIIIYSKSTTI